MEFVPCRQNITNVKLGNCASEQETIDFWKGADFVFISVENYIDLRNQTNPIQEYQKSLPKFVANQLDNTIAIRLAHNEAHFIDDKIGFYHEHTENPIFLTTDKEESWYKMVEDENLKLNNG